MSHQNIVVTVRLSDVEEIDQPDPICLPAGELATWRHFEALLKSMYREPPPIIRVCYLDDESDWIELSSDTELQEAIKVAQDTDEILQLQVKRTDFSDQTFESTISPLTPGADSGPHVTPLQTTYYKDKQDTLVYPHHCVYPLPPSSINNNNTHPLLVYPHPNTSTTPTTTPTTHRKPNENVLVLEANGNTASIQNRPDLSTEEKMRRLKDRLSSKSEKREEAEKGLNTLSSFTEMWQQASNYSSEDKVKFMKIFVSDNDENAPKEDDTQVSKTPSGGDNDDKQKKEKGRDPNTSIVIVKQEDPAVVAPPLQSADVTSSSTRYSGSNDDDNNQQVQDPFEFVSSTATAGGTRKPSQDLEQIHLNLQPGSILKPQKPEKPRTSGSSAASKSVTVDMDDKGVFDQTPPPIPARPATTGSSSSNGEQRRGGGDQTSSNVLRPSSQQMFVKAEAVGPPPTPPPMPPPMPQVRQFMEGAQSGANAVAIEIPEGYHHHQHHHDDGAAQKDEDVVTASGGAACNSSSAETGEALVNRPPSQEGAAVCTKVASAGSLRLRVARTSSSSSTTTTSSSKKSRKSAAGESSSSSKTSPEDVKAKGTSTSLSSSSSKRKSSLSTSASSQDKKSGGNSSSRSHTLTHATRRSRSHNNEEEEEESSSVHVEADVESGEKVVKEREAALQYHEFTKYMKKMKKDLHSAIVKDVAKVSKKLLDKKLCPSTRCDASTCCRDGNSDILHDCIDCDHCCCHIRGIRYKCGNCANYDLCEHCETIPDVHDPTHVMLKLRRPVTGAGFVNGDRVPLLREIIYQQFSDDNDEHHDHADDDGDEDHYHHKQVEEVVEEEEVAVESIPLIPLVAALPLKSDGTTTTGASPPAVSRRVAEQPRKVVADGVDFFVWDSTFDTDHKNLYPVNAEGEGEDNNRRVGSGCGSGWETNVTTLETEENQLRETFSDSEWKRLYDLLCLQAEQVASVEKETETATETAAETQTQIQTASAVNDEVVFVKKEEDEEEELLVAAAKGVYYSGGLLQRTAINRDDENAEEEVQEVEQTNPPTFLEEEDDVAAALESDDHNSSLEIVEAEEDEDEVYEELAGSNDEERQEQEVESDGIGGYQMLDHHDLCDSDTSDDFCVLDPPSRDELEAYVIETPLVPLTASTLCCEEQAVVSNLQENVDSGTELKMVEVVDVQEEQVVELVDCPPQSVEEDQAQAVTETMDVLLTNTCQAVEKEKDVLLLDENAKRTEDEEKKEEEKVVAGAGQVKEKVGSGEEKREEVEDDILVKMSVEERRCFLEMVQNLKDRAEDLEKELKSRKEEGREEDEEVVVKEGEERQAKEGEEIEYRMILKEKQREAARENEKLDAALRKDERERRTEQRDMARSSTSHNKRKENQSGGGSAAGSKRSKATPTLMEMALKKKTNAATSTSTSAPIDVNYGKGTMKDADSQTLGATNGPSSASSSSSDPAAQASQMLHQVASGMSKAAGAAYHTAKDVFYSLQAKQQQVVPGVVYSKSPSNQATGWKPQANTWTPPSSVWTPPADTFVPPKSTWTPPKSEWTTPKSNWSRSPQSEWTSPKSEWTPSPKSTWTPPKSEWTGPKNSEWTPPVGFYQEPGLEEPRRQQPVSASVNADQQTPAPKSQKQQQEEEEAVKKQPSSFNTKDNDNSGSGGLTNEKESASTTSPVARPRTVDKQRTTAMTTTDTKGSSSSKSTPTAPLPPTPTTTPTPQLSASHIADPALRRQVRGMHLLIEMGFANREQNRLLLSQHNGDVEKVVQVLLQEERGESGDHWAWQRH